VRELLASILETRGNARGRINSINLLYRHCAESVSATELATSGSPNELGAFIDLETEKDFFAPTSTVSRTLNVSILVRNSQCAVFMQLFLAVLTECVNGSERIHHLPPSLRIHFSFSSDVGVLQLD